MAMAPSTLTDLPPELLDHITTYLPTAQSVTSLGATNKSLHAFVEKDAWQTFNRTRFPSINPTAPPSHGDVARSLTTLSKAWDRRAFVARYVEPNGDVRAYPGGKPVERWKRPRGQTIGFTPQLDVCEKHGQTWQDRTEVFAFSAGAEVCVRKKRRRGGWEDVRWMTYRPLSASEGRDDVTTLHLLKQDDGSDADGQQLIAGTANGGLSILQLPENDQGDVPVTYFVTNGQPVRFSSVLERPGEQCLLVSNMGDSRISVYPVDSTQPKITPLSSLDIRPLQSNGEPMQQRVWSTVFLSATRVAAGLGPCDEPIQVYNLTPSGFDKEPFRKLSLHNQDNFERLDAGTSAPATKKRSSAIYPIVPLPPSSTAGSSTDGNVFISGAYDGLIRLHDLRSHRDVEQIYSDPANDDMVYSLLPRGQETLVAGTSRHSLLKVFDMRLGAKCYSYLDATDQSADESENKPKDWNLFLRPHAASSSGRGGNGWAQARRSQESPVYSLASPSAHSPYLYAGVENAVLELAFTGALDGHPDPAFFQRGQPRPQKSSDNWSANGSSDDNWRSKEVLDLAMYDQTAGLTLCTQKSLWETWRDWWRLAGGGTVSSNGYYPRLESMDERWRLGSGGLSWNATIAP